MRNRWWREYVMLIVCILLCGSVIGGCNILLDPANGLLVLPGKEEIAVGAHAFFSAELEHLEGDDVTVTSQCTWSSSNTSVATIDVSGSIVFGTTKITATGIAPGTTTITATYTIRGTKTTFSNSATLTVLAPPPPTLQSIVVNPSSATMFPGDQVNLAAIGHYSDGSTKVFTNNAAWVSSNAAVASVGNGAPPPGQVTAVSVGSATITATLTGLSGTAQITVVAPVTTSGQAKQITNVKVDAFPAAMKADPLIVFST